MLYETRFLISLLLTLIVEVFGLLVFNKYLIKLKKTSMFKLIFVGIIASALTLPYLWFVLPPYLSSKCYVLLGEAFVVIIEAFVYNQFLNIKIGKAFLISLMLNAASFLVGLLIL